MNKDATLDYAIDRINKYDEIKEGQSIYDRYSCDMCDFVACNCSRCPFGMDQSTDASHCNTTSYDSWSGTKARVNGIGVKAHQKELIKRTKLWCKKFYPEYTIIKGK